MKVLIWVNKNDVISDNITKYELTRPYHDRNNEWVQILISKDKFTRLEDKRFDKVARLEDDEGNLFKDEESYQDKLYYRKVGDYGNRTDLDINEDVPFGD